MTLSLHSKKKTVVSLLKNSNQNTLSLERDSQQRRSSSETISSSLNPLNQQTLSGKTDTGPQLTTSREHLLLSHSSSSSSVFPLPLSSTPRSGLSSSTALIQTLIVTTLMKSTAETTHLNTGLTMNIKITTMSLKEKNPFHCLVPFNAIVTSYLKTETLPILASSHTSQMVVFLLMKKSNFAMSTLMIHGSHLELPMQYHTPSSVSTTHSESSLS